MSQSPLVALITSLLALSSGTALGQMVPVSPPDTTRLLFDSATGKLYRSSADASELALPTTTSAGATKEPELPSAPIEVPAAGPEGKEEAAGPGAAAATEAVPEPAPASAGAPAPELPSAADPIVVAPSVREVASPASLAPANPDPAPHVAAGPAPATLAPANPAPGSPAPVSPAPVTLPPKPAKIRDLPTPGHGDRPRVRPFQAAAFGLTASTLGAGGELAIPIASTLNLRAGANYVLFRYPFNIDGIDYNPGLKFTSGRATVDWFPHHGAFHISAGALYFRNSIGGSADVVEGGSFSLGGTSYLNSVDDPIHGTASIAYGKHVAPLVLLGFGNVLPRSGRHLSMPFEFGGAYMEPPTLNLKLSGTACTTQGCFNAATDPQVQANLAKEVNTLQSDIRFLQVYPVVSLGLACRF